MSTATAYSDDDREQYENQYEERNENLRHTIDVLASYSTRVLNKHGTKADIAREHDVEAQRIHYVLDEWPELVNWRRHAMANPLDKAAVKDAYDDPTMQAMAVGEPAEVWECFDCSEDFETKARLRGHLGGGECEKPDGVPIDAARQSAETPSRALADGASSVHVNIQLTLDEVFRAVKLLPGDLGLNIYAQTLESDLPRDQIRRILESGSQ